MSFFRKDEIPPHLAEFFGPAEIGLEPTPDAYVAEMVAVFREVRRVLRDDGTLWLNIGDSYSVKHVGRRDHGAAHSTSRLGPNKDGIPGGTQIKASANWLVPGSKPKDLLMIPAMVALALRADGWFLRSDIIWHKPNPMPESVRDRPTSAHEHVFLLSKSGSYYYDAAAIAEPSQGRADEPRAKVLGGKNASLQLSGRGGFGGEIRNARNVWTIATQPYSGAHFATMPPKLVERCIKAGTKPGDVVLDPFGGAGTTGLVADRLGRSATLIELNPDYVRLAKERLSKDADLQAQVSDNLFAQPKGMIA